MVTTVFCLWFFVSQLAVLHGVEQLQRVHAHGFSTGGSVFAREEMNVTTSESEVEILLDFKRSVLKDPTGALSSWNLNDSSPCAWEGVSCDPHGRVSALILPNRKLHGTLSPRLGSLFLLKQFNVSQNLFEGIIPPEIGGMRSMTVFDLMWNQLSGTIPASLGNLTRMEKFLLRENRLTGELSSSFGQWSEVTDFNVGGNNLSGNIPTEFGTMRRLMYLHLWGNSLSGAIPSTLGNLSQLEVCSIRDNQLIGGIPPAFGHLKRMQLFLVDHNFLSGTIPAFVGNFSVLRHLDLRRNLLRGVIPNELGSLRSLIWLNLGGNIELSGIIPRSVCNCKNLTWLDLYESNLSGSIASCLGNLTRLQRIDLGSNRISIFIPHEITNCTSLTALKLSNNLISGTIPDTMGRLSVAFKTLQLNGNRLTGTIPLDLSATTDLQIIDLSYNLLAGRIPGQVIANLSKTGLSLNLSHNQFSGPIPPVIGELVTFQEIDLSMNRLVGEIPPSLEGCKGLVRLDLSWNSLEGKVLESIGALTSLSYFNVSYNQLTGLNPNRGSFLNFTKDSYLGNPKLCGPVVDKVCPLSTTGNCKGLHCKKRMIVGLTVSLASALLAIWLILWYRWWRPRSAGRDELIPPAPVLFDKQYESKVEDIRQAIHNLRDAFPRLLGAGGSSTVYKVELSGHQTVAFKILKPTADNYELERNWKSMLRELDILGQLRHRNLVKLLGVSFTENFRVLVLEYMPNGNLSSWLHGSHFGRRTLDWKTRLGIAVGVASAMAHLHHDHEAEHPIVHRDLKPSNILLDADFVAKVSDFGLAKIVADTTDLDLQSTTSTTLSYTTGYVAPGTTGTEPTDNRFGLDMNIVKWVRDAFPTSLVDILDDSLQAEVQSVPVAGSGNLPSRQIHNVMLLAIRCTVERPQLRPTMQDVLSLLTDIQKDRLGDERSSSPIISPNARGYDFNLCSDSSSYLDRVTAGPDTSIPRLPLSSV